MPSRLAVTVTESKDPHGPRVVVDMKQDQIVTDRAHPNVVCCLGIFRRQGISLRERGEIVYRIEDFVDPALSGDGRLSIKRNELAIGLNLRKGPLGNADGVRH
jgi:hypothetical protein